MARVDADVGLIVARMAGRSAALTGVANALAQAARANAIPGSASGQFAESFHVRTVHGAKGVLDREVYNDRKGALSIETGHKMPDGHYVPGQFALTRAVDALDAKNGTW